MKYLFRSLLAVLALVSVGMLSGGQATPEQLSAAIEGAMEGGNEHTGYSFYVIHGDEHYSAVRGNAAPDTPLSTEHMFRIASITKTYTAATVLRLVEKNSLELGQALAGLISTEFDTILRGDGYNTDAITLKHVLSHTAGLYDHGQSQHYIAAILADPQHVWTRIEQVTVGMKWGDPVGAPGERFFYSDTGYLLLGHIIERTTGKPLPLAVREQLRLDKHGLTDTVWEHGDNRTVPQAERAHQFLAGQDTHGWDPSVDMYGGGGLVATPRDVAHFYELLFAGKIFEKSDTLALMLSAEGLPAASPYRLGIFEKDYGDVHVYEHGGFWGTLVFHQPSTGTTIAGAALQQEDYPTLAKAMAAFLAGKHK